MEHLDYNILNTLKQVMEDDFPLLLETFIQDSTDRIQKLRDLVHGTDADSIRRAVHSFKGSSSNIGALQLSGLCATLERKALAGNLDDLVNDVFAIEQEFAQVQELLNSLR